jgi:dienelactone hydrolase
MTHHRILAGITVLALATGCGGSDEPTAADGSQGRSSTPSNSPSTSPSSTPSPASPLQTPVVEGSFPAGDRGESMAIHCWGTGAPTVVLVAGDDSGYDVFGRLILGALAEHHLTCGYDRLGTGHSDPPTMKRRTVTDVADDLDRLLALAEVPGPYALVGSSGGGLIAIEYAVAHPDVTAALGLLDIGVPNPHLDQEFPGAEAWGGPEHIDWVAGEKRMAELAMPIGDEPVLVLAAAENEDADPEGQRYWLDLSPQATFEVVPGDHDFYQQYPEETADRVLRMLDG